jgi:hypothetical protein
MASITKVKTGMQFRSVIADCNALWEVVRSLGGGAWLCQVVNEPYEIDGKTYAGEYAGHQSSFLSREILSSVNLADLFQGYADEHDRFYASLSEGEIVHYHNGFGQWVRCEAVKLTKKQKLHFDELPAGSMALRPIALLGGIRERGRRSTGWFDYEIGRRHPDGTISWGHYPKKIQAGEPFTPNASNLYEASESLRKKGDPRRMKPIDLEKAVYDPGHTFFDVTVRIRLEGDSAEEIRKRFEDGHSYRPDEILSIDAVAS